MNYKDYLTTRGYKPHAEALDTGALKLHHIKKQLKTYNPTYPNILMLIALDNKQYKTAILDSKQGLIAVPQTPKQLLCQMTNQLDVMSHWMMRMIAKHKGINEYVPYVYGGLSFSPLKTGENGTQTWISTKEIDGRQEHNDFHHLKIWFKGVPTAFIINATEHFIFERSADANLIQRAHDSLIHQMNLATSLDFQESYNLFRVANFKESPLALFSDIKEDVVKKAFKHAGYEFTDKDVEAVVKRCIE
ncbi:hypothetical protein LASUN_22550 [Lentilactobacillus sunkii]|jgi:hypothetical protein|uniref:Uncharacterized protein n=1 Tax=Lentilactobacillus sunkii TaxID=481719 RepID=A0A1E7X9G2_9LACO|nr:hypothetical protein [Lentilactobacillus sunkii]OFA09773.1 hypothetical protein LASUN_22550 [Lentilactobacillus sunkii]